jgi:excisionase family DNA binding protein
MPRLSKSEAARQMGISRTTLYKLIHEGKLSAHPDGSIYPSELVRAVASLSTSAHRERSSVHREHIEVDPRDLINGINAYLDRTMR